MRSVLVQFQPDRVPESERQVLDAFRAEFPEAHFESGEDDGRYWNILFESESPAAALAQVNVVLASPTAGRAARRSCIVSCEGAHGWADYLLLHHYDRTLILDGVPESRPGE